MPCYSWTQPPDRVTQCTRCLCAADVGQLQRCNPAWLASAAALRQTLQIALETTVPHGSNHARNVVGVACHGASADLRMHGVHWRQHMRSQRCSPARTLERPSCQPQAASAGQPPQLLLQPCASPVWPASAFSAPAAALLAQYQEPRLGLRFRPDVVQLLDSSQPASADELQHVGHSANWRSPQALQLSQRSATPSTAPLRWSSARPRLPCLSPAAEAPGTTKKHTKPQYSTVGKQADRPEQLASPPAAL